MSAINNTFQTTTSNTFNSAAVNNLTLTGNFVNMSFFFDEYNLATGLNLMEGFVSRDFQFTGYAVGAFVSGTHGFFSGSLYQRDSGNIKTEISAFSMQSGMYVTGVGGLNKTVSGMNRVGVDILRTMTGVTGVTVGLFGVGYN